MMKNLLFFSMSMLTMACVMLLSCNNDVTEQALAEEEAASAEIRGASANNSPKIMVYYEINDTNPLNALCFEKSDGSKFIDIVQLFASNIHKQTVGGMDWPTIYFNDKLAPVMADADTYIRPLRDAGITVVLNVLGDWQGIGVSNLNATQADRFADILTYIVDTYGLDGIGLDDEYSQAGYLPGSYSHVIKALHAKLDHKFGVDAKMITVFDWGAIGQIDAAAGAMIDIADHGWFGYDAWRSSGNIEGMTTDRWSPMSIEMGQTYSATERNNIRNNAARAASEGYGAIMMFNVRRAGEVNPQPVFQAIATGAFGETVSNVCGTDYLQDWTFNPNGYEITKDDVPAYLPTYTGN